MLCIVYFPRSQGHKQCLINRDSVNEVLLTGSEFITHYLYICAWAYYYVIHYLLQSYFEVCVIVALNCNALILIPL